MTQHESKLDQLLRQRAEIDSLLRRHQTPITVLFTDIVGSTSYFDRFGDTAGMMMLQRHEDLATAAVSEHSGRVLKNIGDSVMAEFPDPLCAVRAAIEIQRRLLATNAALPERDRLQLRVGINHGPGFREQGDVYGDVVNTASRIMKKTGPAQIMVSRAVRDAVAAADPGLRINALGEVTLAGKEDKEPIFEVVWTDTGTYAGLRSEVTVALRRGDLVAPGVNLSELPDPAAAPPSAADATVLASEFTPLGTPPPLQRSAASITPPESYATPAGVTLESRYELMQELGAGGMGLVYKARDRETGDLVALKLLRPEVAANVKGLARFKNELRIARRITHKNVCRIYEFNRTPTTAFISMEFVEGQSLRSLLVREAPLPAPRAVEIARQICAGLREAHAQGVVHRDLKPENVMLDPAGTVKIMDFGIAHSALGAGMTQTDALVGTPTYMAPEQAEGKKVDPRTDIYALGLILYEMVAGTPAFKAETPVAVVLKHLQEAPAPPRQFVPGVPEYLERAILKCLAKKPDERFPSVDELEAALLGVPPAAQHVRESGTVLARPGGALTAPMSASPEPAAPGERAAPSGASHAETQVARTPWQPAPAAPGEPASGPGAPPAAPMHIPGMPPLPPPPSEAAAGPAPAPQPLDAAPAIPSRAAQMPAAAPAPAGKRQGVSAGVLAGVIIGLMVVLGGAGYAGWMLLSKDEQAAAMLAEGEAPATAPAAEQAAPGAAPQPAPAESASAPPAEPVRAPEKREAAPPAEGASAPRERARAAETPPAPAAKAEPAPPPPLVLNFALLRTLAGHTQPVTSVAFSADGRWAATSSRDRSVRVWEAGTGRQSQMLRGHADAVSSVALNPDGSIVASGALDRTVRLWDTSSGRELAVLPKETAFILCVAFSPDGRTLAYSTSDGRIRLWDVASGAGVGALDGHTGPVYAIVFSRDGRWLASAGRDATARVWEVAGANEFRVLRGHSGPVTAVALSADNRWVVTGSEDSAVAIWELSTGRLTQKLEGHTGGVTGVVYGPDGRWVASAGDDRVVRVWEVPAGREIAALSGHLRGITHLTLTRDGRILGSAAGDHSVRLWRRE